jgi:hypothetical protein
MPLATDIVIQTLSAGEIAFIALQRLKIDGNVYGTRKEIMVPLTTDDVTCGLKRPRAIKIDISP